MRDRLNGLEQQLRSAEAQAAAGRSGDGRAGTPSPGAARGSEQGGRQAGQGSGSGSGSGTGRVRSSTPARHTPVSCSDRASLWAACAPSSARLGGSTPEQHEYSRSAPGNEAFKQDFGSWESLRKDVDLALEQFEAAASARLAPKAADRLSAGGSERIPDAYRPVVSPLLRVDRETAGRRPPEKQ